MLPLAMGAFAGTCPLVYFAEQYALFAWAVLN
jgi:hypothetical protein